MDPPSALPAFHLMAKPSGSRCNLACRYCFYLAARDLYQGSPLRMPDEVLEEYTRQTIGAHKVPEVTFAWQGGEPTLLGLDFFKKALKFQKKYCRPGMVIHNTIQTNGILLNDQWCDFFRQNHVLAGISIDGPKDLHDTYRTDVAGNGSFKPVMDGISLLKKYRVEYNILCTINRVNGDHPIRVYRFFRDEIGAQFIQFIPVVNYNQATEKATPWSVRPDQYGRFLIRVFDEWVHRDVGSVFIQHFDAALANWYGEPHGICVFSPVCGQAMVIEHNGDMYSCDHFVDRSHLLGNIMADSVEKLVNSPRQNEFGRNKQEGLPSQCRTCRYLFACHGECPKNRFIVTPDGEPGLNYLCEGYQMFFSHIHEPMEFMVKELHAGRAPANVMKFLEMKRKSASR